MHPILSPPEYNPATSPPPPRPTRKWRLCELEAFAINLDLPQLRFISCESFLRRNELRLWTLSQVDSDPIAEIACTRADIQNFWESDTRYRWCAVSYPRIPRAAPIKEFITDDDLVTSNHPLCEAIRNSWHDDWYIGRALLRELCKAAMGRGIHYVWIDKLCTFRMGPERAWLLAEALPSIYRNAELCLVLPAGLGRLASLHEYEETPYLHCMWSLLEVVLPQNTRQCINVLHQVTRPGWGQGISSIPNHTPDGPDDTTFNSRVVWLKDGRIEGDSLSSLSSFHLLLSWTANPDTFTQFFRKAVGQDSRHLPMDEEYTCPAIFGSLSVPPETSECYQVVRTLREIVEEPRVVRPSDQSLEGPEREKRAIALMTTRLKSIWTAVFVRTAEDGFALIVVLTWLMHDHYSAPIWHGLPLERPLRRISEKICTDVLHVLRAHLSKGVSEDVVKNREVAIKGLYLLLQALAAEPRIPEDFRNLLQDGFADVLPRFKEISLFPEPPLFGPFSRAMTPIPSRSRPPWQSVQELMSRSAVYKLHPGWDLVPQPVHIGHIVNYLRVEPLRAYHTRFEGIRFRLTGFALPLWPDPLRVHVASMHMDDVVTAVDGTRWKVLGPDWGCLTVQEPQAYAIAVSQWSFLEKQSAFITFGRRFTRAMLLTPRNHVEDSNRKNTQDRKFRITGWIETWIEPENDKGKWVDWWTGLKGQEDTGNAKTFDVDIEEPKLLHPIRT